MLLNRLIAIPSLLMLSACAFAEGAGNELPPYRPIFFRILDTTHASSADRPCSYLLGTQHLGVLPSEIPGYVLAGLKSAKRFFHETDVRADLGELPWPPKSKGWVKKLSRREHRELLKLLPPDSEGLVIGEAPETVYLVMEAYALLGSAFHSVPFQDQSMDAFLLQEAERLGHLIAPLDSPEMLRPALRSLFGTESPLRLRLGRIQAAISDANSFRIRCRRMGEQIRSADYAAWVKFESALPTEFRKQLLASRNDRWMANIQPAVREGGAFIAVGTLHLPGENGLVESLRALDFEVEPCE
jgi:uncharacterized protein YbaP (TraB family)